MFNIDSNKSSKEQKADCCRKKRIAGAISLETGKGVVSSAQVEDVQISLPLEVGAQNGEAGPGGRRLLAEVSGSGDQRLEDTV